ncbi:hypothetical protein GGI15_003940 [Coemansia interrupta]|uniref:Uncharacterized protein n=1 Tax=Coemansia interrupta TaxID=1126814 RepID=A0A9W8LHK7_9FUNG|nr:hypothetical protein GGI15_003940 [Coemansia interrupta]
MLATSLVYENELDTAIGQSQSIVFFYNPNSIDYSTFDSSIDPLCRAATSKGIKGVYYFHTHVLNVLSKRFGLSLSGGALFFRDGGLVDYMDGFNAQDFDRITTAVATKDSIRVPVSDAYKFMKRVEKDERAKNPWLYKVVLGKDEKKVYIYDDQKNITIRPVPLPKDTVSHQAASAGGVSAGVQTETHVETRRNDGTNTATQHTTVNYNNNNSGGCCIIA